MDLWLGMVQEMKYLGAGCCAPDHISNLETAKSSIAAIYHFFNNYSAFLLCMA